MANSLSVRTKVCAVLCGCVFFEVCIENMMRYVLLFDSVCFDMVDGILVKDMMLEFGGVAATFYGVDDFSDVGLFLFGKCVVYCFDLLIGVVYYFFEIMCVNVSEELLML